MRYLLRKLGLVFCLAGLFFIQAPGLSFAIMSAPAITGTFSAGTPPWGPPDYDFLFYGLDNINLSGTTALNETLTIKSNNNLWNGNAWPGVVMDKIFFAPAAATTGGIFTADVEVSIGGKSFAAVINPDLKALADLNLLNTTGSFTGDWRQPANFSFSGLPVYAIVPCQTDFVVELPASFTAWDYNSLLFAGNDFYNDSARQYSLALVGTLTLVAENGTYHLTDGSFTTGFLRAPAAVPVPAAVWLFVSGLLALSGLRRKTGK